MERGIGVRSWECRRVGCDAYCWFLDGRVTHGDNREAVRDSATGVVLWAWLQQIHAYEGGVKR